MNHRFSLARMWAVFIKEFQQMLRDRLTFAMAVGIPVLQLILFGYAINTDPKGLPTAVVSTDSGPLSRSIVAALQNTGYFRIDHTGTSEAEGDALIENGKAQFLIVIPPNFSRSVVRGERPALLVSVDATDPSASGNAIAALNAVAGQALRQDLQGPLRTLQTAPAPYEVRIHRRYNPEGLSRYNIVPRGNARLQLRVGLLQRRVAAAMVAVQMCVQQQVQRAAIERGCHQRQCLRGMGAVAAVGQGAARLAADQHIVRGKPAALEHGHSGGEWGYL